MSTARLALSLLAFQLTAASRAEMPITARLVVPGVRIDVVDVPLSSGCGAMDAPCCFIPLRYEAKSALWVADGSPVACSSEPDGALHAASPLPGAAAVVAPGEHPRWVAVAVPADLVDEVAIHVLAAQRTTLPRQDGWIPKPMSEHDWSAQRDTMTRIRNAAGVLDELATAQESYLQSSSPTDLAAVLRGRQLPRGEMLETTDGWGHALVYVSLPDDGGYLLVSPGRDGAMAPSSLKAPVPGRVEGADDDIVYRDGAFVTWP
jgi:hypothetical protein